MFRRRLYIALAVLAAASVLEGLAALWAVGIADRQVQRGRVASDIQTGFVELSATKQRLRTWSSQLLLGADADPAQRERLQGDMRRTLARLQALSVRARELDGGRTNEGEHAKRHDALEVLTRSLDDLERAVDAAQPLQPGTDARAAWDALSRLFDMSNGRDLRTLIAESIAREAAAVARERSAADDTLRWMRELWIGAAVLLALAALLLAAWFAQALRGPLARLTDGVRALQRGDLQHRIADGGGDEFAAVAGSVNAMAAELARHREREARERQRLEELVGARTAELQHALEALQQVDARRRQLFADVSHELRTPTTAIRGEAEVTLRGADKPADEYKGTLRRIVDASRQLGLVIDDLLAMARSEVDALSLDLRTMDFANAIAESVMQARVLAGERGIVLRLLSADRPLPMIGDDQRLRQLMMVLLDNAIRYSHPGGIVEVRVQRSEGIGPDDRVDVQVEDAGIGIAADDLPRVFDRGFRSDQARRHRADGLGLGLPIARGLARAHGGELTIDGAPGRGTCVTLSLPLSVRTPTEAGWTS